MKRLLVITILFFSTLAFSQLSNKHWLPPLHANEDQSPIIGDHYVYLSTPEALPFQVSVKDGSGTPLSGSPFTISQGNPVRIDIGIGQNTKMFIDKSLVNIVNSDKGLILEANRDFYASFRVNAGNHAEFLSSKGITGIGNVFRLGSLPQNDFGGIRNFMASFMATEDNTTVNLSDYDTDVVFESGSGLITNDTQVFTLNKGESVVVSGYLNNIANYAGFVGALLTSNKPIAVNTGNATGGMSDASSGQDINLDQIVPFDQVGKEYVIVKGNGSDNTELPLVIAHEDNTQIFINGSITPIATLNGGDYFLIPTVNFQGTSITNKNMYITANKSFYLYQIVAGSQSDATSGFYFIPPISCFWQKTVDAIPDFNWIGNVEYVNSEIIVVTESSSTITVNNVVTTATPNISANPNWASYRINGITGDVKIESSGALAVGVFGASGFAGFGGYFSGFGSIPKDSQTVVCTGNIVDLFERIPGNPILGGTWSYGGVDRIPNNGFFNPATDPIGVYQYTFTKTCNGIVRTYPILIDVSVQQGPNAGVNSSQTFCKTDPSLDLTSLLGAGVTTGGAWSFNGNPLTNGNFDPATDLSGNYVYTIAASGVCEETSATIAITVNNSPLLENVTPLEECDDTIDGDTNGISLFILSNKASEIIGLQTGITLKYYTNQNDALTNNVNNITTIRAATNTDIFVRLTNTLGCYSVNSFKLIVNPLPVVASSVSLTQCDDDTDAITDFNLKEANLIISTDTSLTYSYHVSQIGATNNTNLVANEINHNAPHGATVWARIQTNKGCFRTAIVNLIVSTTQIPSTFNPSPLEECDNFIDTNNIENDGFDDFNIDLAFTQQIKNEFPIIQQPFLTINYFESYGDALSVQNKINNPSSYRNTNASSQSIWARVDSSLNNDTGCKGIKELQLIVNPVPVIDLGIDFTLCVDPATGEGEHSVDATPSISGDYSYTWTPTNPDLDVLGNESNIFKIKTGGTYSVLVTNNVTSCQNFDSIIASFSSEPDSFTASVITPIFTSELTTIECAATGGFGVYEYSLNLIDWQSSPIFTDLPNGNYTAYVRDLQGCGLLEKTNLFAITYPNFFTPNGDGYHDTWNVFGLSETYEAKIYIFDRYGKLLKQINPDGIGWNGTYNGQLLPATDYWFKIEYTEGGARKEFKSHFTLKR